jgi:hypothetical protein
MNKFTQFIIITVLFYYLICHMFRPSPILHQGVYSCINNLLKFLSSPVCSMNFVGFAVYEVYWVVMCTVIGTACAFDSNWNSSSYFQTYGLFQLLLVQLLSNFQAAPVTVKRTGYSNYCQTYRLLHLLSSLKAVSVTVKPSGCSCYC